MKNKKGKGNQQAPRVGSELESDLKLIQSDPRFAHVTSDPKFRHIPKKERKVKLDSRFHSILTVSCGYCIFSLSFSYHYSYSYFCLLPMIYIFIFSTIVFIFVCIDLIHYVFFILFKLVF